jgi:hypothetical protein
MFNSTIQIGCEGIKLALSPYFLTFMDPRNRFQGMNSARLCSLAGRYDNPILTRFLAPIECLKIPPLDQEMFLLMRPNSWTKPSFKRAVV